jgi:hypothetical protein
MLGFRAAIIGGLALSTGLAGVAPSAKAGDELRCRVHRLSVPHAAHSSDAMATDPTGRWIAGTVAYSTKTAVVRWHDGARSRVDVPFDDVVVTGIDRRGDISGMYPDGSGGFRAFAVVGRTLVELAAPDATSIVATGITKKGTRISGYVRGPGGRYNAVVWDVSAPDEPTVLPVKPGYDGFGQGVTPNGRVAVMARNLPLGHWRSYVVSPAGNRHTLRPTRPGLQPQVSAAASGFAAGLELDPETGVSQVVRWDLANGRAPVALDSPMKLVNAVNADGVIGGRLEDGRAALIIGTKTKVLPGVGSDEQVGNVHAVAATGVAVGFSFDLDDRPAAVTWRC